MKTKFLTRVITAILAVIICFSGMPTVFAGELANSPDETLDLNSINLDEYGDVISNEELGYDLSSTGLVTKNELEKYMTASTSMDSRAGDISIDFYYCQDSFGNNIRAVGASEFRNPGAIQYRFLTSNGDNVYCIEPGVNLFNGAGLSSNSTEAWDNLTPNQQKAINTALCYGLEGSASKVMVGNINSDQAYIATQLIIWEFVKGQRNPNAPFSLYSGCNGYLNIFCAGGANPNIKAAYNNILSRMSKYWVYPSMTNALKSKAPTITLDAVYNELTNTWTYSSRTITDTNKVLSNFKLAGTYDVGNATVKVTQSGNTLKLTCSNGKPNGTPKPASVSSHKSGIPTTNQGVLIAYGSPYLQDVVGGGSIDPPNAYMSIKVDVKKTGTLTRDGYIQKMCWTQSEADDTNLDEGSLSTPENLEGWYFKVNPSPLFKMNYKVDSFILGPTDQTGRTQTISEYIINNIDNKLTHDVPTGVYEFVELGKLKDGASGKDLENDYYFPTGWRADNNINGITGTINFTGSSYMIDNYGVANNIFDIPFRFQKLCEGDGKGDVEEIYFTATNKETNEVFLLVTGEDGHAYLANDPTKNTTIYLPEGTYVIHELGYLKGNASGENYDTDYRLPSYYEAPTDFEVEISAEAYKLAQEDGLDAIVRTYTNKYSTNIVISKKDKDTAEALAGAEFGIYLDKSCEENTLLETIVTKANGKAITEFGYAVGTYYVKEVKAPDGYILDETVHTVVIKPQGYLGNYVEIELTNEKYPTRIKIIKTDGETKEPLEGVVFGVYKNKACTKLLEELTTDENGYAESKNSYRPSTMFIKEITPPANYTVNDTVYNVTITVDDVTKGEPVKIDVKDEIEKARVLIYKYDPDPVANAKPIAGATYGLYFDKACTKHAENLVTGEDGSALSANEYRISTTLYLKELEPAPGYKLNESISTIKITPENIKWAQLQILPTLDVPDGNFVWQRVFDIIYKPYLAVYKTDSVTGKPVEGATYTLYKNKECTMPVEQLTTDANGYAQSRQTYYPGQVLYLEETQSPDDYALDETVYEIYVDHVDKDNVVITKEVQDDPYAPRLTLKKICKQTGLPVAGAVYRIYNSNQTGTNGEILSQYHIGTVVTDNNGYAEIPIDFVIGDIFYVQEWSQGVPFGFTWNRTITKVVVEPDMEIVIRVDNTMKAGTVNITKTDSYGNALEGVTFEVYTANGEKLSFNKYGTNTYYCSNTGSVSTVTIPSSGTASLVNMPLGDYYLIETSTTEGNMPFGEKIEFTVKMSGDTNSSPVETVNITVKNHDAVMFNTGGNGDKVIYFIAGAIFIVAVVFLVFACKRKSAKAKK